MADLIARDPGDADVEDDERRPEGLGDLEGLGAGGRLPRLAPDALEQRQQDRADARVVVDDKDPATTPS